MAKAWPKKPSGKVRISPKGYDILDRMIYWINDYIQYIGYDNMMIG
jgi:hypothetical protein